MSVFDEGWVNHCLSLIYTRAHRDREETLEAQLVAHLRPVREED